MDDRWGLHPGCPPYPARQRIEISDAQRPPANRYARSSDAAPTVRQPLTTEAAETWRRILIVTIHDDSLIPQAVIVRPVDSGNSAWVRLAELGARVKRL